MQDVSSDGKPFANYFSMQPVSVEVLAQRLTWILGEVGASSKILEFAKIRLPKNRRLKKDSFTLPLTEADGSVHQFTYKSDIQNRFYTIHYKKM